MLGSVLMLIVRRLIKGRKQNGKRWRGQKDWPMVLLIMLHALSPLRWWKLPHNA